MNEHQTNDTTKAEILAVGTELLLGDVVNTNSAEIARMLAELGIGVYYQTVVGDNRDRLAAAFRTAIDRADVVVVSGGLGPTEDDLTRETLAEVLERPLHRDSEWEAHLRAIFAERRWGPGGGTTLPENNLRQTMVPEGAVLLPNSRGTAPGIYVEDENAIVVLVPGPPREMRALMNEQVLPRLAASQATAGTGAVLASRVLRIIGLGESRVAELLQDLLAEQTNPTIAPLAQLGEVHLRLTAHAGTRDAATQLIDETAATIYETLGDAIYGEDDTTLEAVVGTLLRGEGGEGKERRARTLAVAESCTGGLLAHRLTNVAGSSAWFRGGIVAYSNEMKRALLNVPADLIEREGAVSEPVARAMATGVIEACGSDCGVAITGIAGPGGGSEAKPVGLTYIAVTCDGETVCHRYRFPGDREVVKARAAHTALSLLRRSLRQ
ncbi:MAG: competence/damage-inducible protein A [Spirochaeta sp.]|nr:competence/damage-inducible protein A [Spirochaeta sp.]